MISQVCTYYSLLSNGRYTQRQLKMIIIPAPGKVNYTNKKAYCPVSLLSLMHKIMQQSVTRNIQDETMGHVPITYEGVLISPQLDQGGNTLQ
jgi:hypothetical protein